MELPSGQEDEIPIPLNMSYGGGQHPHAHIIHHDHHHQPSHNHIIPSSAAGGAPQITSNGSAAVAAVDHHHHPFKKPVKYRECLKNHAAAMGSNATDGCGEFMPSGEEGSLEALTCSACGCHRNFHRKEVDGEANTNPIDSCFHNPRLPGRKFFMGHPQAIGYHGGALISARAVAPHQMIMPYSIGGSVPSESEDQEDGGGAGGMSRPGKLVKKRFRTKFTQEQKEKMLSFAEKVGWKIQKQEEGVVQEFCQEVGVKRRVLKVWMHNNKHHFSKKNPEANPDHPVL